MTAGHTLTRGIRAEINIAPLVDVAMVLLIIFMATTPLMQMGYDVTTPSPGSGVAPAEPITVTLADDGTILLNGEHIDKPGLSAALLALIAGRGTSLVFFDAGNQVSYADAVEIIDVIRRAGGRIGVRLDSVAPGPD